MELPTWADACKGEAHVCASGVACTAACTGSSACRDMGMTCASGQDCSITCDGGANACAEQQPDPGAERLAHACADTSDVPRGPVPGRDRQQQHHDQGAALERPEEHELEGARRVGVSDRPREGALDVGGPSQALKSLRVPGLEAEYAAPAVRQARGDRKGGGPGGPRSQVGLPGPDGQPVGAVGELRPGGELLLPPAREFIPLRLRDASGEASELPGRASVPAVPPGAGHRHVRRVVPAVAFASTHRTRR